MRELLRKIPAVVLALACILIAEPLLHAHPLRNGFEDSSSSRTCGVCATGVDHLPATSPVVAAPLAVLYQLSGHQACAVLPALSVAFDSRGPPSS